MTGGTDNTNEVGCSDPLPMNNVETRKVSECGMFPVAFFVVRFADDDDVLSVTSVTIVKNLYVSLVWRVAGRASSFRSRSEVDTVVTGKTKLCVILRILSGELRDLEGAALYGANVHCQNHTPNAA